MITTEAVYKKAACEIENGLIENWKQVSTMFVFGVAAPGKVFWLVKWAKTNAFSSMGNMKADKTSKSFPTYRILDFEVW